MTKVIAHRGASSEWPQNTLLAYEKAIEASADGIEIDVQVSKDGYLIVMHDANVSGMTDGEGFIKDLTLAQIKQLNAAAKFTKKNLKVEVPTLEEVLVFLSQKHFIGVLNIEVKTDTFEYKGIEKKVITLIDSMTLPFDIIFSSFNLSTLRRLKDISPDVKCAYLYGHDLEKMNIVENSDFLEGHHPEYSFLNLKESYGLKKKVRVWTVNDKEKLELCFTRKVDSVITDDPALALLIREKMKKI